MFLLCSAGVHFYVRGPLTSAHVLQDLVSAGSPFVTTDYMLPTPAWAVYGASEAGFDPQETRVKKVRNHPVKAAAAS